MGETVDTLRPGHDPSGHTSRSPFKGNNLKSMDTLHKFKQEAIAFAQSNSNDLSLPPIQGPGSNSNSTHDLQ